MFDCDKTLRMSVWWPHHSITPSSAQALKLFGADCGGITGIGFANQNESGGNAGFAKLPGGIDELDHALVAQHPGGEDDDRDAFGFGGRDVGVDVDTRAFDQNSLSRGEDLVLNKHALIVGVLENDALVSVPERYFAAQDDQLAHHQGPAGLRNKDVP